MSKTQSKSRSPVKSQDEKSPAKQKNRSKKRDASDNSNSSGGSRKKFLRESRKKLEKGKQTLSQQKLEAIVGEKKKSAKKKSSRGSSRDDSYEKLKEATKRVKDQLK